MVEEINNAFLVILLTNLCSYHFHKGSFTQNLTLHRFAIKSHAVVVYSASTDKNLKKVKDE